MGEIMPLFLTMLALALFDDFDSREHQDYSAQKMLRVLVEQIFKLLNRAFGLMVRNSVLYGLHFL